MYQRILVPVDGPTSDRGLQEAIRLARLTHGELRLIHVIDELSFPWATAMATMPASCWTCCAGRRGGSTPPTAREHGVTVDSVLYENLEKTVQQRVIAEAEMWKADLIVIGTHGGGASAAWCCSSAENILRSAPVPVLLVRSSDHAA